MNEFNLTEIKLIVGLGNIGDDYVRTRHNAGFLLLDKLAEKAFKEEKKFHSSISKFNDTILAKPTTMMNSSGIAAYELRKYYKIKPREIMVVYDDLDLELGSYKLQFSKYPKVHNGLNSIIKYLDTDKFWHLRVGVDSRSEEEKRFIPGLDYVLKRINSEEEEILNKTFATILEKDLKING